MIPKNKVTLTFNKPAYIGMCILELRKVLMITLKMNMVTVQDIIHKS